MTLITSIRVDELIVQGTFMWPLKRPGKRAPVKRTGKAPSTRQRLKAVVTTFATLALLTACAGDAGNADASSQGEGFPYGAEQSEVDAVLEGLEPTQLTVQAGAPAENSISGRRMMDFKEEIETRSNGQIEIDIAWGMAVAGYPEAVDAVVDGRVDISYHLVSYEPQRFPEASAIGTALGLVEYSPKVGEMVANAVANEIGWNDQALLDRYEAEGLTTITPLLGNGAYSLNCNSEINTAADLAGSQVRAGSAGQSDAIAHFDAVPSSLEFTEAFEALQRNTIDCDLSPMSAKEISGIYEAAPHLAYTTQANWPRFAGTYIAGPNFEQLPLAYQQIIFDSAAIITSGSAQSYVDSNAQHIQDLASVDGTITEFDEASQEELQQVLIDQVEEQIAEGNLPEDTVTNVEELTEKWSQRVSDLGFADGGDMESMDEWYSADEDWSSYAWDMWENSGALDHRPGS